MASESVGFLGLGHLGGRMAARLADTGNHLVVFDTDADKVHAFVDEHDASAAGSPRELLAELLSGSDTVPVAVQPKVQNLKDDDFPAQFALRLMHKDFGLIADLARDRGVFMPVTSLAGQINAAEHSKGNEEDFSAVGRLVAELSNRPVG